MTEETKGILHLLKYCVEKNEYLEVTNMKEWKPLLNYITNLQKENEKYKKIFEAKERFSKIMPDDTDFIILSKADYDRQQEDIELTAIKLKSRNEKAIEYIEERKNLNWYADGVFVYELLNILNGGDE